MKSVIAFTLLLIGTVCAARDWSQIHTLVAPGFRTQQLQVDPRIVGGNEAVPHSLPYQAALFITVKQGTAFCGGSVISKRHILTAAHCVDEAKHVQVVLGAHNIRDETESSQVTYNATNVVVHPKWNRLTLKNDLAIVELPEEIKLSENIQIMSLAKSSSGDFNGKVAKASGWGKDSDKSNTVSPVLRYVDVKVMKNSACNIYYFGMIEKTHICTSGKGGHSTCSGDSGGPLVVEGTQVGIVSFGIAFGCEIGWPASYTRVSEYIDWIAENSDVVVYGVM